MRSTLTRVLACALAALACSANAAEREVKSSSTLSDFGIRLIDLAPDDGIAPALTINIDHLSTGSFYENDHDWHHSLEDERAGYGATGVSTATGSASTSFALTGSRIEASVVTDSKYYQVFGGHAYRSVDFLLTPNTGLFIDATVRVDHSVTNAATETASSYAYIRASFEGMNRTNTSIDSFSVQNESGDYRLSAYIHTNATEANGRFELWNYSSAVANGPIPAVPEPETYAMLLAGLGLIGFGARRRG
jgi:hypothetical protein